MSMNTGAIIARGPIADLHRSRGARMATAFQWEFAAEFEGTATECDRARSGVALADLSHLGKSEILGRGISEYCSFMAQRVGGCGDDVQPGHVWVLEPGCYGPMVIEHRTLQAWLLEDQLISIALSLEAIPPSAVGLRGGFSSLRGVRILEATGRFAVFEIVGPCMEDVLRQLTSIDISARGLPPGRCAQTGVARIPAILIRPVSPGLPRMQLWCAREYGQYLWERLLEVAGPLGGGPLGWEAWRKLFDSSTATLTLPSSQ